MKLLRWCLLATLLATASAQPTEPVVSPEAEKLLRAGAEALEKKDLATADAKVNEAEKLLPNNKMIFNLRGCIAIERKEYDKASGFFEKSIQIDPKYFNPKFNIGESLFLQKKFADSRAQFEKIQTESPKDSVSYDLVRYKIFLTYLMEGNVEQSRKMAETFDFAGDSPLYYFAQASLLFQAGDKNGAMVKLATAEQGYPQPLIRLFAESVWEAGWLPRPVPGQAPASPEKK